MIVSYLSKDIAFLTVLEPIRIGTLYAFSILSPSLPPRAGSLFYVHGEVTACISVKEKADDPIQYKLRIERLVGASEQDEMVFNVYLVFRQMEQELFIALQQNRELRSWIENTLQTAEQQFQTFGTHLSVLNEV